MTEHTADLRREEIARKRGDDFMDRLAACRLTPSLAAYETLAEDAIDAYLDAARSQDTATARSAALTDALKDVAALPDRPLLTEERDAAETAIRKARAVLSGETRTGGETP